MFENVVGKNTAIITFENKKEVFNLYFHLSDNPVQHIWQSIHLDNTEIISGIHQGENFNVLLDNLNYYCAQVGQKQYSKNISQKDLNYLHNQFVLNKKNSDWDEINHLIHRIENKINNPFSDFDSSILFYAKEEKFIPIKEEYKIFLNNNVKWGNLVLGYGTLGKDWNDLAESDDDEQDLSIQSTISSETRLLFCPEQVIDLFQEQKFYKWATNSSITVPMDNLNALSLGRYMLGQIIITDELLKYHNISSDWYVPSHQCKWNWNKEVFTPDTKIIKINFENTNLMLNSVLSHTNYKNTNV
jgi:hypothetical protein